MEKYSRAVRRHHRYRIREARKDYHGDRNWSWDKAKLEARRSARVDTATPCSCFLCGNARKHWGAGTMQERRAFEAINCED